MYGFVVLLSLVGVLLVRANREDDARLLDRLDLKNYKKFASEREHTSTDSSDSSSDAKRIALAVEAALKEAALADKFTPAPSSAPDVFKLYRLRLSTTNEANTCATFECGDIVAGSSLDDIIQGSSATATVVFANGTTVDFTAVFNASNIAANPNDLFRFEVSFSLLSPGRGLFTLSTFTPEQFGANVSRIAIRSPAVNRAGTFKAYFDPLGADSFWDETGHQFGAREITLVNGTTHIGCNATFDGHFNEGITLFSVFNNTNTTVNGTTTPAFLVSTSTPDDTFEFQSDVFALNSFAAPLPYRFTGFDALPCAVRTRALYDEIAIVTERPNVVDFGDDTLEHPLIYDELKKVTSFDGLIRELQLAAGRTQLRLRDITLDRHPFSHLSHASKFTPCFRVFPDAGGRIEVFIGLRANPRSAIVRATLDVSTLLDANGKVRSFEDFGGVLPQFTVQEVAFSTLGINTTKPGPGDAIGGTPQRPFVLLDSDVSIDLEGCPIFNYFN